MKQMKKELSWSRAVGVTILGLMNMPLMVSVIMGDLLRGRW